MSYPPPPAESPFARGLAARRLYWIDRVVLSASGLVLVSLLITAARLTPSPEGLGTHQQLGLPPCTVVRWFGVRCPSCGMTTSWSHVMRGQVLDALRVNAGGAMLALAAILGGPWLLISGVVGRWLIAPPSELLIYVVALVIVLVTLVQWAVRLL